MLKIILFGFVTLTIILMTIKLTSDSVNDKINKNRSLLYSELLVDLEQNNTEAIKGIFVVESYSTVVKASLERMKYERWNFYSSSSDINEFTFLCSVWNQNLQNIIDNFLKAHANNVDLPNYELYLKGCRNLDILCNKN